MDFFASERHYLAHLLPIWNALDPGERGTFYAPHIGEPWMERHRLQLKGGAVVVASFKDSRTMRQRPRIYVEHGAGQTYEGVTNGSYSGGDGHEGTELFLCPNERVADRWRSRYPKSCVEVVGSPKVEASMARLGQAGQGWVRRGTAGLGWAWSGEARQGMARGAVVGVSFHSDLRVCTETLSCFPEYRPHLALLTEHFTILGHGHPRIWRRLEPFWRSIGVEPVRDFDEVLGRADVYEVDNSSTAIEFMASGKPVVWLNGKHYRRDVHHGGRFWEWADAGVQCDRPEDLVDSIRLALTDPPRIAARRKEVVSEVYGPLDGLASQRAADAIRHHVVQTRQPKGFLL